MGALSNTMPIRPLSEAKNSAFHIPGPSISLQLIESLHKDVAASSAESHNASHAAQSNGARESRKTYPRRTGPMTQMPSKPRKGPKRHPTPAQQYSLDESDLFAKLAEISTGNTQAVDD